MSLAEKHPAAAGWARRRCHPVGACPGRREGSLGGDTAEIAEPRCHPSPRGPQNPPSPVARQVSSASRCFFWRVLGTNFVRAMQEVATYINYTLNFARRDLCPSGHPTFVREGLSLQRQAPGGLGETLLRGQMGRNDGHHRLASCEKTHGDFPACPVIYGSGSSSRLPAGAAPHSAAEDGSADVLFATYGNF